jgi:hypothetical protein
LKSSWHALWFRHLRFGSIFKAQEPGVESHPNAAGFIRSSLSHDNFTEVLGCLSFFIDLAVNHLAEKQWNFDVAEFEGIVKAEFAHSDRADARDILRLSIPDEGTRELLYRLTLVIGGISNEEVEQVARIPRPISLPLEKMEQLIGIWLQPFLGEKYIISPLVDPAVSDLLEERTRKGVHTNLALTILRRGSIYPLDAVACIHHFTLAGLLQQAGFVLASALTALIDAEPDLVADSMVLASV